MIGIGEKMGVRTRSSDTKFKFQIPFLYLFELRHPLFLDENKLNVSPKLTFCDSYILSHAINILHKNFWSQKYPSNVNVLAPFTYNLSGIHM